MVKEGEVFYQIVEPRLNPGEPRRSALGGGFRPRVAACGWAQRSRSSICAARSLRARPRAAALLGHPAIRGAVVAVAADDLRWRDCEHAREPRVRWVTGGAERCHSVLTRSTSWPARSRRTDWYWCTMRATLPRPRGPAPSRRGSLRPPGGRPAGVPVRDTMKRCAADGSIVATVDRAGLWARLHPADVRFGLLRSACRPRWRRRAGADEAAAMERAGLVPRVVEGSFGNIKVTRRRTWRSRVLPRPAGALMWCRTGLRCPPVLGARPAARPGWGCRAARPGPAGALGRRRLVHALCGRNCSARLRWAHRPSIPDTDPGLMPHRQPILLRRVWRP